MAFGLKQHGPDHGVSTEETEEERALAERGADQWNKYVTEHVPAALDLAQDSRVTEGDRRELASQSESAAAHQTPRAAGIAASSAGQGGMAGGGAISRLQDASTQQALMTAGGIAGGQVDLDRREHGGLMQAVATGHGVDSLADGGHRDAARGATQSSINAMQKDYANNVRRMERGQDIASAALSVAAGSFGGPAAGMAVQQNTGAQDWNNAGLDNPNLTNEHHEINQATADIARNYAEWDLNQRRDRQGLQAAMHR